MPESAHTSYGRRLLTEFQSAKEAKGANLSQDEIVEVGERMCALFIGEALKAAKPPKKPKQSEMTDGEWVASLEQEPHLKGINIRKEIAACQFWAKNNKVLPTRRRIINWLNKAERIVDLKAQGAQHATGLKLPPPPGPKNWIAWAKTELATMSEDAPGYGQILAATLNQQYQMLPASFRERCQRQSA